MPTASLLALGGRRRSRRLDGGLRRVHAARRRVRRRPRRRARRTTATSTDYHCAAHDFARRQPRPIVRFQRSGWTGAARCAQVVWSGDPTTDVGLRRAALGRDDRPRHGVLGRRRAGARTSAGSSRSSAGSSTASCSKRWVQLGAFSGVMRTAARRLRDPAVRPPAGRRSRSARRTGGATRSSARSSIRTSRPPTASTGARACRSCGTWCSPIRTIRRRSMRDDDVPVRPRPRSSRRSSCPARRRATRTCRAGRGSTSGAPSSTARPTARSSCATARPSRRSRAASCDAARAARRDPAARARGRAARRCLPPDVDTLADYGAGTGVVRLADRDRALHVLAFPRERLGGTLPRPRALALDRVAGPLAALGTGRASRDVDDRGRARKPVGAVHAVRGLGNKRRLPDEAWTWDPVGRVLRATVEGARSASTCGDVRVSAGVDPLRDRHTEDTRPPSQRHSRWS